MSAKNFSQMSEVFSAQTVALERINMLFDEGSFVELDRFAAVNGAPCGVICGYGAVGGSPVCAFSQDGSGFGKAQGDKIAKLYDLALKTGVPVVGIYDSPGARVGEGVAALEAYGELLLRINNLSGVVPQIALVLGNCTGSSAMLACSADFVVMSKNASFFLTPPSLARDADELSGTAEAAAKAGVAHVVAASAEEATGTVARMLSLFPINNLAAAPVCDFVPPAEGFLAPGSRYDEASGRQMAEAICDGGSILPLMEGMGKRVFAALATMGGNPIGILATEGDICANCGKKMAKLVSVCDAFQIPVVTLVNTTGFKASAADELTGAVQGMARLAHVYAEATTAKVAVITGRAYGAAYVVLASRAANSDYTIAYPEAVITPLAPQAAAAFLHGDKITPEMSREEVVEQYEKEDASPLTAATAGYLDDVISPELTRPAILAALDLLSAKRVSRNPKKHSNLPM